MTASRRSILFAVTALLAVGPAVVFAKGKQPEKTDGGYKVTVAGHWTGTGSATVHGGNVTISAEVTDGSGNKGAFAATGKLEGAHFKGEGTAIGQKITITGRLDGYAPKKEGPGKGQGKGGQGKAFQGARLLGSYTDGKNSGRIAGVKNSSETQPDP